MQINKQWVVLFMIVACIGYFGFTAFNSQTSKVEDSSKQWNSSPHVINRDSLEESSPLVMQKTEDSSDKMEMVNEGNMQELVKEGIVSIDAKKSCRELGLLPVELCGLCEGIENAMCQSFETEDSYQACFTCASMTIAKEEIEQMPEVNVSAEMATEEAIDKPDLSAIDNALATEEDMLTEGEAQLACDSPGFLSEDQCADCPNCVFQHVASNGTPCFQCEEPVASTQCEENGYDASCNGCASEEFCKQVGVIVFHDQGKSPLLDCFKCVNRNQELSKL